MTAKTNYEAILERLTPTKGPSPTFIANFWDPTTGRLYALNDSVDQIFGDASSSAFTTPPRMLYIANAAFAATDPNGPTTAAAATNYFAYRIRVPAGSTKRIILTGITVTANEARRLAILVSTAAITTGRSYANEGAVLPKRKAADSPPPVGRFSFDRNLTTDPANFAVAHQEILQANVTRDLPLTGWEIPVEFAIDIIVGDTGDSVAFTSTFACEWLEV